MFSIPTTSLCCILLYFVLKYCTSSLVKPNFFQSLANSSLISKLYNFLFKLLNALLYILSTQNFIRIVPFIYNKSIFFALCIFYISKSFPYVKIKIETLVFPEAFGYAVIMGGITSCSHFPQIIRA